MMAAAQAAEKATEEASPERESADIDQKTMV